MDFLGIFLGIMNKSEYYQRFRLEETTTQRLAGAGAGSLISLGFVADT